jgi:hypothetical protein
LDDGKEALDADALADETGERTSSLEAGFAVTAECGGVGAGSGIGAIDSCGEGCVEDGLILLAVAAGGKSDLKIFGKMTDGCGAGGAIAAGALCRDQEEDGTIGRGGWSLE